MLDKLPDYRKVPGNAFRIGTKESYCLVLNRKGNSLIITKKSPGVYEIKMGPVPADATPWEVFNMPPEFQTAFGAAAVTKKITDFRITTRTRN